MDKFDAMGEIRRLARKFDLAVSVITVDDVLALKGFDSEADLTDAQHDAIVSSWEWKHYGDNWSDWFEGFMLPEGDST